MILCLFVTYLKNRAENLFVCGSFHDAFNTLISVVTNVVMINK
jgi:hypothetical protein